MQVQLRNLPFLRSIPEYGAKLYEAFQDVQTQLSNVTRQTNANPQGETPPPPQVNSLHVDGGAGVYHAYINDSNQNTYRDNHYFLEYSQDANFTSFHVEHMGPSRDKRLNLGVTPLYFRAYSQYPTSQPSAPVYHGGQQGTAVSAGGNAVPPLRTGMGSGTNPPTLGGGGFGHSPFRTTNGLPPKRS